MLTIKKIYKKLINKKLTVLVVGLYFSFAALVSCGDKTFLEDAVSVAKVYIESGDILILSGGSVARTATPFPLHQIHAYASDGRYKGLINSANSTSFLMGMAFDLTGLNLIFTVDGSDRVDQVNIYDQNSPTNYILDSNLTGATLRAVAVLSDGGTVVAESTTSIEKYDSSGVRVTTNFPITVTANVMKVRSISGGRFVIVNTGGNDSPSIRNNNGTSIGTVTMGLACGTNCDPSDILELPDGRFIISYQIAASQSLELYSSTFVRVGTLFLDTSVLQGISAMTLLDDGTILACSTTFNLCEKLLISGNTATRVGTTPFIDDVGKIRQPTDVVVVP